MGVFGDVYRTVKSEVRTFDKPQIDLKQMAADQLALEQMRAQEAKHAEIEKRIAAQTEQQRKWDLNNGTALLEHAKHAVFQKAAVDIPNILAAEAFASIYIKALPHDRDYVLEKYQAFKNMGMMYMRKLGGIAALKQAAQESGSPFLTGMYNAIMEVSKEAVKRVTADGQKCLTEEEVKEMIQPRPTDEERNKLINKIDELGSEELAELVNSKVIKVVTDERKAEETAKQLDTVLLSDIQGGDMTSGDDTSDDFQVPDVKEGSEEDDLDDEEDEEKKDKKKSKKDKDDEDEESEEDDEESDEKKSKKKKKKSDKDDDSEDDEDLEDDEDSDDDKKSKKKKKDKDEDEDDESDEEDSKDKKKSKKKDDDLGDLSLEAYHSILKADMRKVMEAMEDDDDFDIEEYLADHDEDEYVGMLMDESMKAKKIIHDNVDKAYQAIKDKKDAAQKALGDTFGRASRAVKSGKKRVGAAIDNASRYVHWHGMRFVKEDMDSLAKSFEAFDPVNGTMNYKGTNEGRSLFFSIMCSVTNDMIHQTTEGARTLDYTKVPKALMENPLNLSVFYQYMNENSTRPASYVSENVTNVMPNIGKKEILSEAIAQYTLLETAHTMKLIKVNRAMVAEQAKFLRSDEQYMVPVSEFLGVMSNKAHELLTGNSVGHEMGGIGRKVKSMLPKIETHKDEDDFTAECGYPQCGEKTCVCEPDKVNGDVKVVRFADTAGIQATGTEFAVRPSMGLNGIDPKRNIFGTKVDTVKAPDKPAVTPKAGFTEPSNPYNSFKEVSFTRLNDVQFGKP